MNEPMEMLSAHEIKGVIHIGANIGQEIPFYRKLDVPVLYFEPLDSIFDILIKNIGNSEKIKAEKLAVGSSDMEMTIFESSKEGVSSSLLKPDEHLKRFPNREFKEVKCNQVKLDTYFQTNEMIYNTLVMDIQGYEYYALEGAVDILKDIDIILLEVWYKPLYQNTVLKDKIDSFLKDRGFQEKEHIVVDDYFGNVLYTKIM